MPWRLAVASLDIGVRLCGRLLHPFAERRSQRGLGEQRLIAPDARSNGVRNRRLRQSTTSHHCHTPVGWIEVGFVRRIFGRVRCYHVRVPP